MPARIPPQNIVILCIPPIDLFNVVGPMEAFRLANRLANKKSSYQIELVSTRADLAIESETGINLQAHYSLSDERWQNAKIDTLIITSNILLSSGNPPDAIKWINTQTKNARRICSLCGGIFALAQTGMLNGKRITTHWRVVEQFAQQHPQIKVDDQPVWVKDGNIYTSAGMSASIDMALSLIAEDRGDALAAEVSREMVLFLRRPGHQPQQSLSLLEQSSNNRNLKALQPWLQEHLTQELSVEILADQLAMSRSTLIRIFKTELNTTPAKYVENVRLETARRFLLIDVYESGQDRGTLRFHQRRCDAAGLYAQFRHQPASLSPAIWQQRINHRAGVAGAALTWPVTWRVFSRRRHKPVR